MRQLVMTTGDVYAIVPMGTNVHRFEQVEQFEYGRLGSTVSPEGPFLARFGDHVSGFSSYETEESLVG